MHCNNIEKPLGYLNRMLTEPKAYWLHKLISDMNKEQCINQKDPRLNHVEPWSPWICEPTKFHAYSHLDQLMQLQSNLLKSNVKFDLVFFTSNRLWLILFGISITLCTFANLIRSKNHIFSKMVPPNFLTKVQVIIALYFQIKRYFTLITTPRACILFRAHPDRPLEHSISCSSNTDRAYVQTFLFDMFWISNY